MQKQLFGDNDFFMKKLFNKNQKVQERKNNSILTIYQEEIKNKIQVLPPLKGLVYGRDYHQEDLITIENYLKSQKETPFGYQLILKTKPYFHMVYQETKKVFSIVFKITYKKFILYLIKVWI